jgi:hypothetical protein
MISFTFHGFTHVPHLKAFRYLLRLDDDSCLSDPVGYDIFKRMKAENYTYAYKQIFKDPDWTVRGLKRFAEDYMASRQLQWQNPHARHLVGLLQEEHMYAISTNLEVLDMVKYRSLDVASFVHHVIQSNQIYHRRWGDAPLRLLQLQMFYRDEEVLKFCEFGYQHSVWPPSPKCPSTESFSRGVVAHLKSNLGKPYLD